jgi:outer membrane protein assembly factor BamB
VGVATDDTAKLSGSLVAFDAQTGRVVWQAGDRVPSYASPVRATLAGVDQVLAVEENYLTAYATADGQQLWQVDWPSSSSGAAACSQPVPLSGDRVLLTKGYGTGARLVKVELANDQWSVQTVWSAPVLKTKFSNVLVRDGYAYGIDDIVLQCVDIETGKSVWKKRRRPPFGHGQNMLVGDHIFIISEEGEGILIEANHAEYVELASLPLITSEGITWNNPAIAGDLLLVRNDREAAAYRLPRQPLQ